MNVGARRWVTATFAGWTGGIVLGIIFILIAESLGLGETQFPVALGVGIGVGFAQARVLAGGWPDLQHRSSWVLATAIGLAAPFALWDIASAVGAPAGYSLPVWVALGGIGAGILQWRILRTATERAALWLAASPLGWMLAAATVAFSDGALPKIPGVVGALMYLGVILVGGVLLGIVGAIALGRMTERSAAAGAGA